MRLRVKDLERREFLQMPKWLYEIKGLKSIDREIYMLGYNNWRLSEKNNWVNEDGEIFFLLSLEYLEKTIFETRKSIIASLKTLVEHGVLECEKHKGKATKYFLVEMSKKQTTNIIVKRAKSEIKPKKTKKTSSEFDTTTTSSEFDTTTSSEFDTTTSSEFDTIVRVNSNNNKIRNIIINKTNYIDRAIFAPGDNNNFIFVETKKLKKYLFDNIQDVQTCKNIMFLVENNPIDLNRIKEVTEYSKKIGKDNQYIVAALRDNWSIPKEKIVAPAIKNTKKTFLGENELPQNEIDSVYSNDELIKLNSKFSSYCRGIKYSPDTTPDEKIRIKKLQQDFNKITCINKAKDFLEKNNFKIS